MSFSTSRDAINETFKSFPQTWALTPVRDKRPYRKEWQHEQPLSREAIAQNICSANASGVGLRLGQISGGILAIDFDGHSAFDKWLELSGGVEPPLTVKWTSGKDGRFQIAFQVSKEYWGKIASKKIATGWDASGKAFEYLEIRWDGCQSVLPPSDHPTTPGYIWLPGQSPQECEIATIPDWLLEVAKPEPKRQQTPTREYSASTSASTNILTDSGWDIRNFSYLLDGYKADGRKGWDTCKCPGHSGESNDSMHINQSTGQFKCHNECDTKDIYRAALELAKSRGYQLPKREQRHYPQGEPTIDRDTWEHRFGLPKWLKHQVERLSKYFKKSAKFGFEPGDPKPKKESKPDGSVIRFKAGERIQIIAELVKRGHRHILDSSQTGSGKSYDIGLIEPARLDVDRLWYFSQDHRNPTTATVEANYTDLPVRNDGLVVDGTRRTALNNPHVRWPQGDEIPNTGNNCFRTNLFHVLAKKGYQHEVNAEAKLNPVCESCHLKAACAGAGDALPLPGGSFRSDRREVFGNTRIRASLDSAPSPSDLEERTASSEDGEITNRNGCFVDEASRQIRSTRVIEVNLAEFDKTFAELESKLPDIHTVLKPLRLALRPILAGEIAPTQQTYYGWNDGLIREALADFREQLFSADGTNNEFIIPEFFDRLKTISPDLEKILAEPDGFTKAGVKPSERSGVSSETSKFIRQTLRQESYRDVSKELQALVTNWLIPLLQVWSGGENGALRITNGVLSVTQSDTRHAEILRAMRFVVYLDATATRQELAQSLGINTNEIIEIQQELTPSENLSIVQVTDLGLVGRGRSDSLKERLGALKPALRIRHPDLFTIEHKPYAEEGDGWWFNHSRGSNEYQKRSVIASFGVPFENIGALQDWWLATTGDRNVAQDSLDFAAFVQAKVQAEIIQSVGRLRSNLRPGEPLVYYFCADFDLSFLEQYFPGAAIQQESAFSIAAEAGSSTEQSHHRVQQGIFDFVRETGAALEKLTQTVAATATGVSQGRLSQIAAKFGGWREYKKILAALLESLYTPANKSRAESEDYDQVWTNWLPCAAAEDPERLVEVLSRCAEYFGWQGFTDILSDTSAMIRGGWVATLINALPADRRDEMRSLFKSMATN